MNGVITIYGATKRICGQVQNVDVSASTRWDVLRKKGEEMGIVKMMRVRREGGAWGSSFRGRVCNKLWTMLSFGLGGLP